MIDVSSKSSEERIAFINRQKQLIIELYRGDCPDYLSPEEDLLVKLVSQDRRENTGLHSFIHNFIALLEFDARRKDGFVSRDELTWYSNTLAKAVTDGIQYFIGNKHEYPDTKNRYKAVTAAHITHMLRDMVEDISNGFVNIPRDHLKAPDLTQGQPDSQIDPLWVRGRVELARQYLREGKAYLEKLDVLRCKLAGYWYCARYEGVLDRIEKDGYRLRVSYNERRKLSTVLKIAWWTIWITAQHLGKQVKQFHRGVLSRAPVP